MKTKQPPREEQIAALETQVLALQAQLEQERQRAQQLAEKAAQQERFLQKLAQHVPVALYLHHLPRKTDILLNDRLWEILGYPLSAGRQFKLAALETLLHPYDQARVAMHYANLRALPDGGVTQVEVRLRCHDGSWKWCRIRDTAFAREPAGVVRRSIGSVEDISEEKVLTDKLTAQKEFYESILNSLPADVAVLNANYTYLFTNPSYIRDAELRRWMVGKTDFDYCQRQQKDASLAQHRQQKFTEAITTKAEVTWEDTYHDARQQAVHTLRKYYPVLDESGQVLFVITYGLDITPQKSAELRLKTQQELITMVVQKNPNPICVKDASGRVMLANDAWAQLYGTTAAAGLQEPARPDYSYERDLEILHAGTRVSFEELYKLSPERKAWYHTTKAPFATSDATQYLLTISSDITVLKQARRAAEASSKAKEVFLANMSHEIRTPMNGILGLARLLQRSELAPQQVEYLDNILLSAENLLVLLDDVLDFAKIESGKISLERIPFAVAPTVQNAVKALQVKAAEKGLLIQCEWPPEELPTVLGDPLRLNQVLLNLMNNAIKFTSSGSVTVRVTLDEQVNDTAYLQFCVEDTGIGIAADKLDHIFESFSQADSSTTRLHGGTGLGLSICKDLVELQGGQLWVRSKLGQGSRFYFTLPYPVSDQVPASKQPSVLPAGALAGLRVLLAEDNAVNQLLAVALLRSWKVEVELAENGEQALAKAQETPFDLILMDIRMPQLSGVQVTSHLRKRPNPNQHTPIIALTANALKKDLKSYARSGFTGYLVKPYHETDLYSMLAKHTGKATTDQTDSSAETSPSDSALYDFSGLGKLAQDAGFVKKMQQLFIDTVPAQLEKLTHAAAHHDWAAVADIAHTLKSTCGNLRIREAEAALKKIEEMPDLATQPERVADLLHTARTHTSLVITAFKAQLNT